MLLALLALGGLDMRITVLAVPPLLTLIHRDLGLSETAVGALTALPTLLFSLASVGGALLIARLGARRAVIAGFVVVGIAGALRGAGPSVAVLFALTLVMGVGISLVQPAFPTLVRIWTPARVELATATYSTGILVGEAVPPALTAAFVLPLAGGWPLALAFWSLPVFAGALLIALLTPHSEGPREAPRWWPDWRHGTTWRLGLMMGGVSALYWSCNTFIPDLFQRTGRGGLISAALIALNAMQIFAALGIAALPQAVFRARTSYVAPTLLSAAAIVGLLLAPGWWAVVFAGLLGLLSAWVFVLALALPPLLADLPDVPRLAAGMFTVTYICSFTAATLGGFAWDSTGRPAVAFLPAFAGCALVALMAAGLTVPSRPAAPSVVAAT